MNINGILHPTDFSKASAYALELACSLARHYEIPLSILHVAAPSVTIEGEAMTEPRSEEYLADERRKLEQMRCSHSGVPIHYELVEGDPAEEILRFAREHPCDFIVMGSHGRTALQRLLMGSVAEEVVRRAPCPVIVVKHPLPRDLQEDIVEEVGEESFPASDPPSWTPLAAGPPARR